MAHDVQELLVEDARAWDRWLETHHADRDGVWLVLAKKGTDRPTNLTYDQALDEALCQGWIDGQLGRRDEATYRQRFTPRKIRSRWSQSNVARVERLIEEGRMRPAGLAAVERARVDGSWESAYAGQSGIEVPPDLAAALERSPEAQAMFQKLSSQNRYAILFRLGARGAPSTRARRLERFMAMLERGETIHPQGPRR
jgi:uncharacterized protein YdeI (YjbR/CyaY-like superfamily)